MKKLTFLVCVLLLTAFNLSAQWQAILSASVSSSAPPDITADLWSPMETASPSATTLKAAASGGAVAASAWSTTGTQVTSTSAQHALPFSTINGSATTGTYGYVGNHDVPAYFTIDLNTYPTTQSVGFMVYVTALTDGTYTNPWVFGESTAPGLSIVSLRIERSGSTYTAYLFNSGGTSGTVPISIATWYWVTVKAVQSGTCSLAIYNTSGVQVGSTQTLTGTSNQPFYHSLGGIASSSSTGDTYIDNFVIDKTTATFPLGP
ncbi:MAG: hypothetical protein JSR30_00100 [Proteobacteria bacterium]|nr:hypothetical protein [Pseudomonadota bacterium]